METMETLIAAIKTGDIPTLRTTLTTTPTPTLTTLRDANGLTLLHHAASSPSSPALSLLLSPPHLSTFSPLASTPSSSGLTPLHLAAASASLPATSSLLSAGANPNARDAAGRTPLHVAAFHGLPSLVQALVDAGGNIHAPDADGRTPVDCALAASSAHATSSNHHPSSSSSDPFSSSDPQSKLNHPSPSPTMLGASLGLPPITGHPGPSTVPSTNTQKRRFRGVDMASPEFRLWAACDNGDLDVVSTLIEKSHMDSGLADGDGVSGLHFASAAGHDHVVAYLLDHHASVGAMTHAGVTPLHLAAANGHANVVHVLLSACVGDLEPVKSAPDDLGRTPLHMAAWEGHYAVVECLVLAGARLDVVSLAGNSILHMAAAPSPTTPKAALVQLLLDAGLRPSARNASDQTPAELAAVEAESIQILLSGAPPPESDPARELLAAAKAGDAHVARRILPALASESDRRAVLTATDPAGFSPLHWASYYGHSEVAQELLAFGSPVDARAFDGRTPLCLAAAEGRKDLVVLLLGHNASPNAAADDGTSPLHAATAHLHVGTIEALVKAGGDPSLPDRANQRPLTYLYSRIETGLALLAPHLEGNGLEALRSAVTSGQLDTFLALLDAGISPNVRAPDGTVPLTWVIHLCRSPESRKASAGMGMLTGLCAAPEFDVDIPDNDGWTGLMLAAGYNLPSVAYILLQAGANVNAYNKDGRTPLHIAAFEGNAAIVHALLGAHADPLLMDAIGNTPIAYAKSPKLTQTLRDHAQSSPSLAALHADNDRVHAGTGTRPSEEMASALRRAAAEGRLQMVQRLLDPKGVGVDVNAADDDGVTALHWAAELGHVSIIRVLLDVDGINVNAATSEGATPLHWAVDSGLRDVVLALLNAPNVLVSPALIENKTTPLHSAAAAGSAELVGDLIASGATINAGDVYGDTPLHAAVTSGSGPCVRLLLLAGARVDIPGAGALTPVHLAVGRDRGEILAMLLSQCTPGSPLLSATDETGASPIHYALVGLLAGRKNEDEIEALLLLGADVNSTWDAHPGVGTPLHFAALDGHVPVAYALLQRGANANARNVHGLTPLHYAADSNQADVAVLLLAHAADPSAVSLDGETPIDWASESPDVLALLPSVSSAP